MKLTYDKIMSMKIVKSNHEKARDQKKVAIENLAKRLSENSFMYDYIFEKMMSKDIAEDDRIMLSKFETLLNSRDVDLRKKLGIMSRTVD